jgi:hypothetical protein
MIDQPRPPPILANGPPPPIDEWPPEQPQGINVQWLDGYWGWDADISDFLWVSGIWQDLPPNRQWVPGYWTRAGEGWQRIAGFWAQYAGASFDRCRAG